jgi:outer membrane immunogenic protein
LRQWLIWKKDKVIRMFKHLLAATVAVLAAGLAPLAKADGYSKSYQASTPVYSWTGIYLGVNGGYGWGHQDPFNIITDRFDNINVGFSGGLFGATAGAQVQVAHVVLGVEAEIDWADINGSSTIAPTMLNNPVGSTFKATTRMTDVSTAGVRVGYAQNNWLFFATGGAAIIGAKTELTTVAGPVCSSPLLPNCSGTSHRLGGMAGLGMEYAFAPNWSMKVEYEYIAAASLELSHLDQIRVGLNYRFGGN